MTLDPEELEDLRLVAAEKKFKQTPTGIFTRRALLRAAAGTGAALAATPAAATISALMCPPEAGSFGGNAKGYSPPDGAGAANPDEDYSGSVPDDGPGLRKLHMTNWRTGETFNRPFVEGGSFSQEAVEEFTHFARDWRQNEEKPHDPQSIEYIWKVARRLNMTDPFNLNSGYRNPTTNASIGGATNSYHMRGKATDISTSSRSVSQIYNAGMTDQQGGVGKYTSSGFVHLDSGPVRTWGS